MDHAPVDWHDIAAHALACVIRAGEATAGRDASRLMLLFNPEPQSKYFALPTGLWQLALDSSGETPASSKGLKEMINVPARAVLVLRALPQTP